MRGSQRSPVSVYGYGLNFFQLSTDQFYRLVLHRGRHGEPLEGRVGPGHAGKGSGDRSRHGNWVGGIWGSEHVANAGEIQLCISRLRRVIQAGTANPVLLLTSSDMGDSWKHISNVAETGLATLSAANLSMSSVSGGLVPTRI